MSFAFSVSSWVFAVLAEEVEPWVETEGVGVAGVEGVGPGEQGVAEGGGWDGGWEEEEEGAGVAAGRSAGLVDEGGQSGS